MVKKKVSLLELDSNPNIGLYMFVNDKFCLIGEQISKEKKKEIENILQVPIYSITILGTGLIGVFLSGNNDFIIIPTIYDHEKKELEKIMTKHQTKIIEFDEKLNTFGNGLCFTDDLIIANNAYDKKFINKLEKETKLKITILKGEDLNCAGGVCRYLNGKLYISQNLEEKNYKEFSHKITGVGTVNSGALFIASGIVGNSNGLLIGSMSTTIEIQNIVETLDYL
ncbi:MAG: hypothetical protein KC589_08960 [Nanoarchaeota archaeon]|nr:hypothetical protein [Nanoarchaeota archaeon]